MTGFEPGSSGIGGDRSANCATTTAHLFSFFSFMFALMIFQFAITQSKF